MNNYHVKPTVKEFPQEFLDDVNLIIFEAERRKIKIVGYNNEDPDSKPIVNKDCIRLNGAGLAGQHGFALDAHPMDNCKQATWCDAGHLPYDAVVKAILRIAFDKYHLLADWNYGIYGRTSDPTYRRSTSILKKLGLIPGKDFVTYKFKHRFLQEVTDEVTFTGPKGLTSGQVLEAYWGTQNHPVTKTSTKKVDSKFDEDISWTDQDGHEIFCDI